MTLRDCLKTGSLLLILCGSLLACGDNQVAPTPSPDTPVTDVSVDASTTVDTRAEDDAGRASASCGDGLCDPAESPESCPDDCAVCALDEQLGCDGVTCIPSSRAGDGQCDEVLNCDAYAFDGGDCLPALCGDGSCAASEDATSCPEDCIPNVCGDGQCGPEEDVQSCPSDCIAGTCGDGICTPDEVFVDPRDLSAECTLECFLDADFSGCVSACVQDATGLTTTCSDCYGALSACGFDNCASVCSPGNPDYTVCETCIEEAGCTAGLDACIAVDCVAEVDQAYFDSGCPADCGLCDLGEVTTCDGATCVDGALLGNGQCDGALDCASLAFDAGDCSVTAECGDGVCEADEAPLVALPIAEGCLEQCLFDEDVEACIAECTSALTALSVGCARCYGDFITCTINACPEVCDGSDQAACMACVAASSCPEAQVVCEGEQCSGEADQQLLVGSCPGDCVEACQADQQPDCSGGCRDSSLVGDGICHPELNCQQTGFDGDDCVPGLCANGLCDVGESSALQLALICAKLSPGDATEVASCTTLESGLSESCAVCIAPYALCRAESCEVQCSEPESEACLSCLEVSGCTTLAACQDEACTTLDEQILLGTCPADCQICEDGQVLDCEQGCSPATWVGDGECHAQLNCVGLSYDGGDCESLTCGNGVCEPEERPLELIAAGTECLSACSAGDECTLNCLQDLGFSAGCAQCQADVVLCNYEACLDDCFGVDTDPQTCGLCFAQSGCLNEAFSTCVFENCSSAGDTQLIQGTCPTDCAEGCADGAIPDCQGICQPQSTLGDGVCDSSFDCAALGFDNGDCLDAVCGDAICGPNEGPADVFGEVSACVFGCGADQLCATECASASLQLTSECAACYVEPELCTQQNCSQTCQEQGAQACSECKLANGCELGATFSECVATSCDNPIDLEALSGTCPADCGGCPEGYAADCQGNCADVSWLGDGQCDAVWNCPTYEADAQDCVCSAEELSGCLDECVPSVYLGDGYCDPTLACPEHNYDAGDCDTCGNGFCGPGELPGSCVEDCGASQCGPGEIDTCWGGCDADSALGDDICDPSFNCVALNYDEGDCCPPGSVTGCDGESCVPLDGLGNGSCDTHFSCIEYGFDEGDCVGCGNGICDPLESAESCEVDCGILVECALDEVAGCDGLCYPSSLAGDGVCHPQFACDAFGWDAGDCCKGWEIEGCGGQCLDASWLGDDYCDTAFDCEAMQYDNGDCDVCGNGFCGPGESTTTCTDDCGPSQCPEGQTESCDGSCQSMTALGNGVCDAVFQCKALQDDFGDCCGAGFLNACGGGCVLSTWLGDGFCDPGLNCDVHSYDDGDCQAPCPSGEVANCSMGCSPDWFVSDGTCDPELDCEAAGWDGGDCLATFCGNGVCEVGEVFETCPFDCAQQCPEGQLPSCTGQCETPSFTDGTCDEAFNCAQFAFDGTDCAGCGDGYCTGQENPTVCPLDCGISTCDPGTIDDCSGGCIDASSLGDGQCDQALSCDVYGFDEGDCCSIEGQIKGCEDLCAYPEWQGDGICDSAFNCSAYNLDGGDCDLCGDGVCGLAENKTACPQDCGVDPCSPGQAEGCDGQCHPLSEYGDEDCDAAFSCAAWGWDDGQCCKDTELKACDGSCVHGGTFGDGECQAAFACEALSYDGGDCCPEGQIKGCDGATCVAQILYGDGVCQPELQCDGLQFDGGDCAVICDANSLPDCQGGCAPKDWFGDEFCDLAFQCAQASWDGGDCCPDGFVEACDGSCQLAVDLGDGLCHPAFNCQALNYDSGDCGTTCAPDEFVNCFGVCSSQQQLADGTCDPVLACEQFAYDGGDCCLPEEVPACGTEAGEQPQCVDISLIGDGSCDESLACITYGFDDGDCSSECPLGYVLDCDDGCQPEAWLGDGQCDDVLDCAETGADGGDCATCGDGICVAIEDMTSCPVDCSDAGFTPGGSCDLNGLGDGVVDCQGQCKDPALNTAECEQAFNCPAFQQDGGACCPPGQRFGCQQTICYSELFYGDGLCDDYFDCASLDFDGGDCASELLVINEFDPDQAGQDDAEFVELYNAGQAPVTLSSWRVQHINGATGEPTDTWWLGDTGSSLFPGEYLVIGTPAVVNALPDDVVGWVVSAGALQNGNEALVVSTGSDQEGWVVMDSVGFNGGVTGFGEGEPLGADTESEAFGRCPNGGDSGDNLTDFVLMTPSPGAPNACDICGDGVCTGAEAPFSCISDCPCPPGTAIDCNGVCGDISGAGDGVCSPAFDCQVGSWDGGDCYENTDLPVVVNAVGADTALGIVSVSCALTGVSCSVTGSWEAMQQGCEIPCPEGSPVAITCEVNGQADRETSAIIGTDGVDHACSGPYCVLEVYLPELPTQSVTYSCQFTE